MLKRQLEASRRLVATATAGDGRRVLSGLADAGEAFEQAVLTLHSRGAQDDLK